MMCTSFSGLALVCIISVLGCGRLHAAVVNGDAELHISLNEGLSLQQQLIALADKRLQPAGLSIDARRARLSVSGPMSDAGTIAVRPLWVAEAGPPPLPLQFELRTLLESSAGEHSPPSRVIATLAAPLMRDVWVASRRVAKGSAFACTDMNLQRRELNAVPAAALPRHCALASDMVALRDIAVHSVVRSGDVGAAPDVAAGGEVRVDVQAGGISVTTTAIASSDARVGELIEVRLQHPSRRLKARVTGPGNVRLAELP